MPNEDKKTIQEAKDRFRQGDQSTPGQWIMIAGLNKMIEEAGKPPLDVIEVVQAFDTFTEDNDP